MESTKAPSPTSLALGTLVVIWTEVARKRVSFWVAVRDTMEVMETRRVLVSAQKENHGLPQGAKPEPVKPRTEARATYERMRESGVRFK